MGLGFNVHVHVHTSSTLTSHEIILDGTSGVRYLSFATADELRRGGRKIAFCRSLRFEDRSAVRVVESPQRIDR